MNPTFRSHQILYFTRNIDEIGIDNVVVFKRNGETCIKRITGIPGGYYLKSQAEPLSFVMVTQDSLKIRKSKYYTIQALNQDEFYIEGDNRGESFDSNRFGPIKRSQIIGKLFAF